MIPIPAEFTKPLPTADDPADAGLIEVEKRRAAFMKWSRANKDESDERCDRDANLDMRLERFLAKAPAHTLRGLAVKLRALERHGGSWPNMDEPLFKTALKAVAELVKA